MFTHTTQTHKPTQHIYTNIYTHTTHTYTHSHFPPHPPMMVSLVNISHSKRGLLVSEYKLATANSHCHGDSCVYAWVLQDGIIFMLNGQLFKIQ